MTGGFIAAVLVLRPPACVRCPSDVSGWRQKGSLEAWTGNDGSSAHQWQSSRPTSKRCRSQCQGALQHAAASRGKSGHRLGAHPTQGNTGMLSEKRLLHSYRVRMPIGVCRGRMPTFFGSIFMFGPGVMFDLPRNGCNYRYFEIKYAHSHAKNHRRYWRLRWDS